jgi:hypothetical protein
MTEGASDTSPSTFEDFVTGRLTIITVRNQLDTQVAQLRSQLVVAESQLRQSKELLHRADEAMTERFPDEYAALVGEEGPPAKTKRRTSS